MNCSTPGLPVHHQLRRSPKPMSIESVMPSNHLILCLPLLLLPSIFLSIRVFSNESALHIRWPKYWSFSFNISPSNEYSGLISFRIDWLDLLEVQGTLKSLLQHHNSKASILKHSAFFTSSFNVHPITQSCPTLWPPWTSPPGSFVHGILQARTLEWVAIPFSRGSSLTLGLNQVSWFAGRLFTVWATREAPALLQNKGLSEPGPILLSHTSVHSYITFSGYWQYPRTPTVPFIWKALVNSSSFTIQSEYQLLCETVS